MIHVELLDVYAYECANGTNGGSRVAIPDMK